MKLSYLKLTATTATAISTTVVGFLLMHLVHKHHTTQILSPPTKGQFVNRPSPRLSHTWLYPHAVQQSDSTQASVSHVASIGGTIHKKTTTKTDAKAVNTTKKQPSHVPSIPLRTVLGYVPYYAKTAALSDMMQHRSSFSETGDWSFSLLQNGSVHGTPNQALLNFSKSHGLHVYASISDNYNRTLISHVLSTISARQRLTKQLLQLTVSSKYTGINLDLENIPKANRTQFTAFVSHLASELHKRGKLLTVAIPAIDTSSREGGYDLTALGRTSDGLVIMAYDYTFLTQAPGPIAPISWVRRVVSFNLQHVPARKLILGIGAYGYDWGGTKAKAVSEKTADTEVIADHMSPQQNPTTKTEYFTYMSHGNKHTLYYETSDSVTRLVQLARSRQLLGIALWHAGSEDKAVDTVLSHFR